MFIEPKFLPLLNESCGITAKEMILKEAESLFGKRDKSFIIKKKIYYHNYPPRITPCNNKSKKFSVILGNGSKTSWGCFMFEMAHEAVHLLNPQSVSASYLEEGIAVWFSEHMCKKYNYAFEPAKDEYKNALDLLNKLPDSPPDIAKKIRSKFENLTDTTDTQILSIYPNIPACDAIQLCLKMQYKI